MSDIAASERRLSAALDRMDQLLETNFIPGTSARADVTGQVSSDELAELRAENQRLQARVMELQDRAGSAADDDSDIDDRLADAGEQAARLAAANDELANANRALLDSLAGQGDVDAITTIRQALEAEIEALRAARAAEISNLGDIIMELERLLPDGDGESTAVPSVEEASGADTAGTATRNQQGVFSAVYGDGPDDAEDAELEDK